MSFWSEVGQLAQGASPIVLGSALTLASTSYLQQRSRKEQSERFKREQEAVRAAEVRKRTDERALRALEVLDRLSDLLPRLTGLAMRKPKEYESLSDEADQLTDELRSLPLFFTEPLRRYLTVAVNVLTSVDGILQWTSLESSDNAHSIVWRTVNDTREALGRHLRGETIPPELPSALERYERAHQTYQDEMQWQHEEHQKDVDKEREQSRAKKTEPESS